MSTSQPEPTEEELRAYEEQLAQIRVEHILLEQVVTLVNLGMRRTGIAPGTEGERDPGQVQLAIEGIKATLPLIEGFAPEQSGPIRQALSQLQMAYVRIGGAPPADGDAPAPAADPAGPAAPAGGPAAAPGTPPPGPAAPGSAPGARPGEPGPAQQSGRLWIPGQ